MSGPIHELSVEIVRFVSDDQPGWVESELEDAAGRRHTILDKVPIFTCENLDAESSYPRPGVVRCRVLDRWTAGDGRELARISTGWPDGVESTEAVLEFVVLSAQLLSVDAPGGKAISG